jgi:hypothetical protein
MGTGKLVVEMLLPMAEVWKELWAQADQWTGRAGGRLSERFWLRK